jgi:hypothetical protein
MVNSERSRSSRDGGLPPRRRTRVRCGTAAGLDPAEAIRDRAAAFVREARLLGADDEQIVSVVARALGH